MSHKSHSLQHVTLRLPGGERYGLEISSEQLAEWLALGRRSPDEAGGIPIQVEVSHAGNRVVVAVAPALAEPGRTGRRGWETGSPRACARPVPRAWHARPGRAPAGAQCRSATGSDSSRAQAPPPAAVTGALRATVAGTMTSSSGSS